MKIKRIEFKNHKVLGITDSKVLGMDVEYQLILYRKEGTE